MGCSICIHELKSGFFFCYFVLINLFFFLKSLYLHRYARQLLKQYSIPSSFCCGLWLSNKEQRILLQAV